VEQWLISRCVCVVIKAVVSQKMGEFKSRDEALIGVSERQLSHICADLDQRVVHLWQQLRTIDLQQ